MLIVGISGKAGAGKDLSANHLCSQYGFVKVSFADPLKRIAREVYDFSDEQLWGPSESRNAPDVRYLRAKHERHDWQESGPGWKCSQCSLPGDVAGPQCLVYLTPRLALQRLGTEGGRDCYENTWVDYALRVAKRLEGGGVDYTTQKGLFDVPGILPPPGIVIPDVRFDNELYALQKVGGFLIRIKRPTTTLSGSAAQHASEQDQEKIPDYRFNAVIDNTSSIQNLTDQLDMLFGTQFYTCESEAS